MTENVEFCIRLVYCLLCMPNEKPHEDWEENTEKSSLKENKQSVRLLQGIQRNAKMFSVWRLAVV